MSGPGAVSPTPGTRGVIAANESEGSGRTDQPVIPDTAPDRADAALELPTLPLPKVGGLSLETLVQALGMEERATAARNGVASIKAKAAEREKTSAERIETIKKNIETMEAKKTASSVFKVFKAIGAILGAVAAVATTAVGIALGNPLLIAGGALLTLSAASNIASVFSDGKYSIATGVAAFAKNVCGASDKVAQIIGMATELSITIAGCVLSFAGASGAINAAQAASAKAPGALLNVVDSSGKAVAAAGGGYAFSGSKFLLAIVPKAAAAIGGVTAAVSAAGEGVNAYYNYKITRSQADLKEFAAILERIQQAIDMDTDFVKALMERNSELAEKVGDVVKENAQAQMTILSGVGPAMA